MTGREFSQRIKGLYCDNCNQSAEGCRCLRMEEENEDREVKVKNSQNLRIRDLDAFSEIIKDLKVLGRATPIDKYSLVAGLKELGNVVAVTGDGSNDAQALSKADVGFAMGIQGTEVAKDASDIIVLDDNFASIVNSIKWGRSIFDNIRKFLQFQLSVNLSAVLLVFVTSCIGSESPISAIQMLWLNLIMDSLGSLALATEPPSDDVLRRKPYSKREYLINGVMWKSIIVQSMFQFTIIFILYILAEKFIIEEDEDRIYLYNQLENCFGDFSAELVRYQKHSLLHYIIDGKKSSWNALHLIKPNLSGNFCMFYKEEFSEKKIRNLADAYNWYTSSYGNTTHMTIVFNCFVLYSLFNQINARIINSNLNILKNIHKNFLFITVFLIEIFTQVLLVQKGGIIFKCAVGGLTAFQWFVCLAFASLTIWVGLFSKFIPCEKCGEETSVRKVDSANLNENLILGENRKEALEE